MAIKSELYLGGNNMKTYVLDVVEQVTYSFEIKANSLEEAEEAARTAYNLAQLNKIDEGLVAIDLVEEFE